MTSVSAGFVRRHVNGVRYGQEARERSGTDFQPSTSPSAYTSTRPQNRTSEATRACVSFRREPDMSSLVPVMR